MNENNENEKEDSVFVIIFGASLALVLMCLCAFGGGTILTVQTVNHSGVALSFVEGDATNGNRFANDGKTFLVVRNDSTTDIDITIETAGLAQGGISIEDISDTLISGTTAMYGPFIPAIFNGADDSRTTFTVSKTGVYVAPVRFTPYSILP